MFFVLIKLLLEMLPGHGQIIGMSATLSNGAELAAWLEAILHVSDYRPVPLDERVLVRSWDVDKSYEYV